MSACSCEASSGNRRAYSSTTGRSPRSHRRRRSAVIRSTSRAVRAAPDSPTRYGSHSSDAAREPYETWGGYGSAKAALDHLSSILGAERPDLRVYAFDPGDMATDLQQQAFPGEDVSDRPSPESVVPSLLRLVEERRASGRYTVEARVTA